jgi:hypothetical protein
VPEIPPRGATDDYIRDMSSLGRRIDIAFDVALGALVYGHRVVAHRLELADSGALLHYEFVPGLGEAERKDEGLFFWYWLLQASDDQRTRYADSNSGGYDQREGRAASHGYRELGGAVPAGAKTMTLRFEPPSGWTPPGRWRRELVVDLRLRRCEPSGPMPHSG